MGLTREHLVRAALPTAAFARRFHNELQRPIRPALQRAEPVVAAEGPLQLRRMQAHLTHRRWQAAQVERQVTAHSQQVHGLEALKLAQLGTLQVVLDWVRSLGMELLGVMARIVATCTEASIEIPSICRGISKITPDGCKAAAQR